MFHMLWDRLVFGSDGQKNNATLAKVADSGTRTSSFAIGILFGDAIISETRSISLRARIFYLKSTG